VDRNESVIIKQVGQFVEEPIRMMIDKSKEIVYVPKVEKSGTTRNAIVVLNNISGFSPELEHAPKHTF
jgi:hypothetical protein